MPNHKLTVKVYQAGPFIGRGGWRWCMFRGGNQIAVSGRAYARKDGALRALTRLKTAARQTWEVVGG
jgi:hypothetical protein